MTDDQKGPFLKNLTLTLFQNSHIKTVPPSIVILISKRFKSFLLENIIIDLNYTGFCPLHYISPIVIIYDYTHQLIKYIIKVG